MPRGRTRFITIVTDLESSNIMRSIALGVVVFQRTEKLENLLRSVGPPVQRVYVADNGEVTQEKMRLYDLDYEFDLEVIDLEYDSGLGHGRNEIVKQLTEDYLIIVDNDMEMPANVSVLADQLESNPDLGGVCGVLIEDGNVSGSCCDLYEERNLIIKDIREEKRFELLGGHPFVEFDFIVNAAMFRNECLEDYSWDSRYRIGIEHIDFYVGHMKQTDWTFGICPAVVFPHYPGGDATYMAERNSVEKLTESKQYFLEKWGYRQYLSIQSSWVESFTDPRLQGWRFLAGYGARMMLRRLPARTKGVAMDVVESVRYA